MRTIVREITVTGLVALIAAVVYWKSLSIPPGLYDPLGAGTMPRIICGGILLFCAISLVQVFLRHLNPPPKPRASAAPEKALAPLRPWLAVGSFVLMVLLAIAIQLRIPFEIAASLFLFIGIMAIQRFKLSAVPGALVMAIIFGVGVAYLFGTVFSVDLP